MQVNRIVAVKPLRTERKREDLFILPYKFDTAIEIDRSRLAILHFLKLGQNFECHSM